MGLSDYMNDDEWAACFYAYFGQHHAPNFGESMRLTIDYVQEQGYRFAGLDSGEHVPSRNAEKVMVLMGIGGELDIPEVLDRGRSFLKQHAPGLVDEDDREWARQQEAARARGAQGSN